MATYSCNCDVIFMPLHPLLACSTFLLSHIWCSNYNG